LTIGEEIMEHKLTAWIHTLGPWAVPAGILLGGLISLIGFIPTVIITGANVWLFGPWLGGFISWMGELLGSTAAFLLYRAGFKKWWKTRANEKSFMEKLGRISPLEQGITLTMARITPFIPSGLVNLAAAFSPVTFAIFALSTAIGKIPSIAVEALVSHGFLQLKENSIRLAVILLFLGWIFFLRRRLRQK
jgi:uncharacterized membrane protein YdjX (TVP38/TMEM64 family)